MAIIDDNQGAVGKVCTRCNIWKPLAAFKRRSLRGSPGGDGYITQCRDCQNADRRARRAADPERYREQARTYMMRRRDQSNEYQRAWRLANSDKVLASLRKYRTANRATVNATARARRAANTEYYRMIGRASLARHREQRNAASRAYGKAHPEWRAAKVRARRNRKYQAEGFHTDAEWEALKMRYDNCCLRCGRREPEITLTRDHVLPITKGGSDWITNIQPLCHSCNSSKNARTIDYRVNWRVTHTITEAPEDR